MSWPKGPWENGEFGESGEFGENGKFGENLPKGLTKANELAQRAPWKAAIWRKRVSNPQYLPTTKKMSLERRHVLHVHK